MKLKSLSLLAAFAHSKDVPEPTIRELVETLETIPKTWSSGFTKKFHPDSKPSDYKLNSILNYNEPSHNEPSSIQFGKAPVNPPPKVAPEDLPAEFDPRVEWGEMCPSLYAITDQGNCADGWAMSSATTMSDRVCIQTAGAVNVTISPQDVLECCHGCVSYRGGCEGGYMPQNWMSFVNYGVVSGGNAYGSDTGCKPYALQPCDHYNSENDPLPSCESLGEPGKPVCSATCTNPDFPGDYNSDLIKMATYVGITNHKVTDIQSQLMSNGPMETTLQVYDDFLTYTGGVYYHVDGRKYNFIHMVRLLGWGYDEESDMDYWLVANSWNSDWGENGYFRIRRGTNECGIEGTMYAGDMPGWEQF